MKPASVTAPFSAALATAVVSAALLSTALAPAVAQAAAPGCASVEVQNVRPQQGRLMVAAFLNAETFSKKAVTSMDLAAGEATMRFDICGLSGDSVALTLYQDLDSDGKMGRNLLGIPTEPWGATGKPGMMGPTWDSTRMALDGQVLVVKMSQ
jgi:uncharacterized protein (DUF2141 family)